MENRTSKPWMERALRWPLFVILPVLLLLTSVRLLLTPAFVRVNYAIPGFPADPYGFTREERLQGADVALDYLLNDQPIGFLGDLRFENGQPVYNDRELKHMEDVKVLVQQAMAWQRAGEPAGPLRTPGVPRESPPSAAGGLRRGPVTVGRG